MSEERALYVVPGEGERYRKPLQESVFQEVTRLRKENSDLRLRLEIAEEAAMALPLATSLWEDAEEELLEARCWAKAWKRAAKHACK